MTTYIIRRLLLMIPTVIGMTLLIFMLVAMSPGGVGAALNVSGGGQMDSGSVAQQRAYLAAQQQAQARRHEEEKAQSVAALQQLSMHQLQVQALLAG
ncbi:MAG: hypothetical protein AAFV77_02645, partial [Planctomycetota bacterium]